MEKNLRLRVVIRSVVQPQGVNSAPIVFSVNCWRLTVLYGAFAPTIDGADFNNLLYGGTTAGVSQSFTVGGVYDRDGLPVYLNQSFTINDVIPGLGGLILVEEYLDHNARQNR